MRKGIFTEIDWKYIGAVLANSDEQEQTDFFKSFIKECNSWGTNYQVGVQLAGVNHNLTDDEKETISMLGYRREED